jgi:hypothetical protein
VSEIRRSIPPTLLDALTDALGACVPTLGTLDNNGTVSGYIQVRCAARLLAEGFQGSDHVRFA